jgi:PKD repeat protein
VLHTYAADGIYPVSLTVTNSCGTDTYLDTINIGNVGITTVNDKSLTCLITPNPATGHVQLQLTGINSVENFTVSILDLAGKETMKPLVYQHQPGSAQLIPLNGLHPGIYIFQIKTLDSSTFQKIIIY